MSVNNNAPWWGPGRPMVVADPRKLSYFAQANMIRAGVRGSYGLGGLGETDIGPGDKLMDSEEQGFEPLPYPDAGAYTADPPGTEATAAGGIRIAAMNTATSGSVAKGTGAGFIDSFVASLNNLFKQGAPPPPVVQQSPSLMPYVLVGAGLLVGGVLLMKLVRK